jgi:hypothetical protein
MGLKVITFIDSSGNVILKGKLTSLPLKEEFVINKSIELFNDCEPCIIHRTFVMKKMFLEIDEYLDKILKEGRNEIQSEHIPDNILQVLDINGQAQKIRIN